MPLHTHPTLKPEMQHNFTATLLYASYHIHTDKPQTILATVNFLLEYGPPWGIFQQHAQSKAYGKPE